MTGFMILGDGGIVEFFELFLLQSLDFRMPNISY